MVVSVREPEAGTVFSVVLSMVSIGSLSICLSRRVQNVRNWSRLPLVCWLVLVIYTDSIFFASGTAVLSNGFGIDSSDSICTKALLLCLSCYMTTKVFIYFFLVERAYIIRRSSKPRLKDTLYLFNTFGMLIPYCVVIALNFYFRFAIYENRTCRIGMKRVAMIPLIGFDILVNVYLTSLFLIPLRSLYSYKNNRNSQARTVALRTFIGSCCTLTSSVVNLTVVMVLNGEPGWICLMCCNIDILFSVLVLHWITSKDNASTLPSLRSQPTPPSPRPQHPTLTSTSSPLSDSPYEIAYLPTPPKRLVPRPPLCDIEAYELGLSEWGLGLGGKGMKVGVTTMVSARDLREEGEEGEEERLPLGVVTVETSTGDAGFG
ncbi:uncharacterized protein LY89DRAFT_204578 [Mollisia scopiformis]|uniref:Uncharacterized protein n=1 Tax=Mollisia scopiformis TaxID=149040 RepID=A0A194WWC8_MOLSC|nr:uncharacterized protein LY89DRAFT_204578 [Mollisia scopiformis]KUJ12278.1 hypothetical protein LY89DRAFT_204578 [Mollisia scopiformis]